VYFGGRIVPSPTDPSTAFIDRKRSEAEYDVSVAATTVPNDIRHQTLDHAGGRIIQGSGSDG